MRTLKDHRYLVKGNGVIFLKTAIASSKMAYSLTIYIKSISKFSLFYCPRKFDVNVDMLKKGQRKLYHYKWFILVAHKKG